MNYYLDVWKKYAKFDGRARGKEYWYFVLFNILISFVLGLIDGAIMEATDAPVGVLGLLYMLAALIPGIAVTIRRLHDTGRSGFWILISFIPLVGPLILLIFLAGSTQPGPNEYGPDPTLEGEPAAEF
ncbi:DUF805 domain-containing protein [Calycomorphotria hydatis]|uniref:Inner membrane protein YhaH n=1 Tax=Calycomorphotria hydatis TaxID=2528027 RepID=A0A517TF88_9PLAN|nr:DUF805 domain-containing protein [Calycomorphotria hydatis]QDT67034.1 Inner membrane protein YhaH [Calycomorphotria hydatis]